MNISYKKLWKLLIDRDMRKKDLREAAGISPTSIAKLAKNENISTDVLVKICKALKCDIGDIMEILQDDEEELPSHAKSATERDGAKTDI
jgi:putative transcriptional regulator